MVKLIVVYFHCRKSVKSKNRADIAESIEDARIWASDMASGNPMASQQAHSVHQYEMIKKNVQPYETLNVRGVAMGQHPQQEIPPPPSDSSDVDTLLAHQNVIAHTHADGSYFMTPEGTYVQLVNGVLTNVDFQPSPPASVTYSQLQFSEQNYPHPQSIGGQQQAFHQAQSLPAMGYGQQHSQPMGHNQVQTQPMSHNQIQSQPMGQNQVNAQSMGHNQVSSQSMGHNQVNAQSIDHNQLNSQLIAYQQSLNGSVTSSQMSQAPTVSHMSQASVQSALDESLEREAGKDAIPDSKTPDNTRMNMRIQRDMANLAGMKCSQF